MAWARRSRVCPAARAIRYVVYIVESEHQDRPRTDCPDEPYSFASPSGSQAASPEEFHHLPAELLRIRRF